MYTSTGECIRHQRVERQAKDDFLIQLRDATADSGLKTSSTPSLAHCASEHLRYEGDKSFTHALSISPATHQQLVLSSDAQEFVLTLLFNAIYTAHASSTQTASNTLRLRASSPARDQDTPLRQSLLWVRRRRTTLFVVSVDKGRRMGKEGFTHSAMASVGATSLRPGDLRP